MAFEYHSENGKTLTKSQEEILEEIENLPFLYGDIDQLKDLRKRTGVSFVISDRMSLIRFLRDSISSIKAKIEEYKTSKVILNGNVEGEIYHRLRWAEQQLKNAEQPSAVEMPLLGLYTRKLLWFDNSAPVVYLFADNIEDYAANHPGEMDEDNVFAFVFVHEMMHAYYDAFNSIGFPAKEPIEEAFAEFGMLSFLYKSFGSRHPLFDQARFNVCSKIENRLLYYYGFGLELFELSGRDGTDGTDMIQKYRDKSNWIDYSVINKEFHAKGLGNYFADIAHYKNHHDDDDLVEKCFKDVQDILNYTWQQPSITVQPRVSVCRASSITSPANPSGRKYPISLVYCSPAQTEGLVCLIREKEIETILAAVIRLLKHEGFESGLTFYGRHVHYLGKDLFCYTTSTQKRLVQSIVIPESISVSGTIVLPMFIGRGLNSSFGGVLRLLSELVGDSFALVREAEGYGLYGPPLNDNYKNILAPKPKLSRKHRFDVIVRETSEVLGHDVGVFRVPLLVVKHFCESNNSITWRDLQIAFDRVECHLPKYLDWITPKPIVEAFYSTFTPVGGKTILLFHDDPIHLASGETVLVLARFMSDYQFDFNSFLKVADSLGYEIREVEKGNINIQVNNNMKIQLDEKWKDYLSIVYDNLCRDSICRMSFRRGIIIADDESGYLLNYVNNILHFDQIKQRGRYNEITIDNHWPFNDDDLFRGKLIEEAERTNNGLLRINITDKRVFDEFHCKLIKELSKREEEDFKLDIYVLLVIKDHTWKEVEDYANMHSLGQFNDMMSQWYRRIM